MKDFLRLMLVLAAIAAAMFGIHEAFSTMQNYYSAAIEVKYCTGVKDTLFVVAFDPDPVSIATKNRAITELYLNPGMSEMGKTIAYNVCEYRVLSLKLIGE